MNQISNVLTSVYWNRNNVSCDPLSLTDWSSRCKQIMKIWRKISAADKVPFLQKAKDNRAAQRINKAQKVGV